MDKLIEKFGVFDILASFVPGMITVIFSLLWIIKMNLIDEMIYLEVINIVIDSNLTGMLYILFVCFSYVAGVIVDALRRELIDLFFCDWRAKYPIDAKRGKKKIYKAVFEEVLGRAIDEAVLDCKEKKAKERNTEVCNYCMTALEIHGGISKAERMLVLSEMNGSLALIFFVSIFTFSYSNVKMGGGLYSWLFVFSLAIVSVILYRSYSRFSRYRVESIFKSYYFKFIKATPQKPALENNDKSAK